MSVFDSEKPEWELIHNVAWGWGYQRGDDYIYFRDAERFLKIDFLFDPKQTTNSVLDDIFRRLDPLVRAEHDAFHARTGFRRINIPEVRRVYPML